MNARKTWYVYAAILDSGVVKVGRTANPNRRLSALKFISKCRLKFAFKYRIPHYHGAMHLERFAMHCLSPFSLKPLDPRYRCEWFKPAALGFLVKLEEELPREHRRYSNWLYRNGEDPHFSSEERAASWRAGL